MTEDPKYKVKERINPYMKYSGLAFQLAGIIGLSFWIGKKADAYFNFEKPILTISLIFVTFSLYLYKLYIELTKKI
ncbi:MAG: AtpZ/AtpI family protein [Lewinellaceae bacterium]|nr:AtpZ/AtpI family protein [Lewinellaceae bacterium]